METLPTPATTVRSRSASAEVLPQSRNPTHSTNAHDEFTKLLAQPAEGIIPYAVDRLVNLITQDQEFFRGARTFRDVLQEHLSTEDFETVRARTVHIPEVSAVFAKVGLQPGRAFSCHTIRDKWDAWPWELDLPLPTMFKQNLLSKLSQLSQDCDRAEGERRLRVALDVRLERREKLARSARRDPFLVPGDVKYALDMNVEQLGEAADQTPTPTPTPDRITNPQQELSRGIVPTLEPLEGTQPVHDDTTTHDPPHPNITMRTRDKNGNAKTSGDPNPSAVLSKTFLSPILERSSERSVSPMRGQESHIQYWDYHDDLSDVSADSAESIEHGRGENTFGGQDLDDNKDSFLSNVSVGNYSVENVKDNHDNNNDNSNNDNVGNTCEVTNISVRSGQETPNRSESIPSADRHGALEALQPGQWISDTTIELALMGIPTFKHLFGMPQPLVKVLDSSFFSLSFDDRNNDLGDLRIDHSAYETILIPFNHKPHFPHFSVATLNLNTGQIQHYDSMPQKRTLHLTENALLNLGRTLSLRYERLRTINWQFTAYDTTLRQVNTWDCGIYTIVISIYLLLSRKLPDLVNCDFWRLLLRSVLSATEVPEEEIKRLIKSEKPVGDERNTNDSSYAHIEAQSTGYQSADRTLAQVEEMANTAQAVLNALCTASGLVEEYGMSRTETELQSLSTTRNDTAQRYTGTVLQLLSKANDDAEISLRTERKKMELQLKGYEERKVAWKAALATVTAARAHAKAHKDLLRGRLQVDIRRAGDELDCEERELRNKRRKLEAFEPDGMG